MSTISKFSFRSSYPLVGAWKHILHSILKVPSDAVCELATGKYQTSVQCSDGSEFGGELPVLAALQKWTRSSHDAAGIAFVAGQSAEEAAFIRQWVTIATRLVSENSSVAAQAHEETERFVSLDPQLSYLTGSNRATIADVLVYAALPDATLTSSKSVLSRWARTVVTDDFVKPLARAAASSSSASAGQPSVAAEAGASTQQKASTFTKPTAEEIERRRLEKEKAKAEKEKAKGDAGVKVAAANPNAKPAAATPTDATGLDIRVGKITAIARHPEADKLFVETIDLGTEQRNIVSGLVDYYTAEELEGRLVLVVCNLKPKPLKGVVSQGMVLCASIAENGATKLSIVSPPEGTAAGTRVSFGGNLSETAPEALSNNTAAELLAHLNTDAAGVMRWKEDVAAVPLGNIASSIVSAVVK